MSRFLALVLLLGSIALPSQTGASEPPRPIEGLDSLASATLLRALDDLGIRPRELGFDKLYVEDDTFRLGIVEELLDDPLALPGWQSDCIAQVRSAVDDPGELVNFLAQLIEADQHRVPSFYRWPSSESMPQPGDSGTPRRGGQEPEFENEINEYLRRCRDAESWLSRAFHKLDEEDRRIVLTLAPAFWGERDHPADRIRKGSIHFEVGQPADTTIENNEDRILTAAAKVDRSALGHAAYLFQTATCDLITRLGLGTETCARLELPGVMGPVLWVGESPYGSVVIGGEGDNVYSENMLRRTAILIDPAGDDVYRGRAASAVGGLTRTLSALVDLGGNDLYDAGGLPYAIGGAVLGIATLIDLGGDDLYRGEDACIGAGFFGAGLLYDRSGTDSFEGRNFCQGAGGVGIGALISDSEPSPPPGPELQDDRAYLQGISKVPGTGALAVRYDENDIYRCARYSQGFASTFGAGLLYDRTGNDTYRSGGTYLHAPLLPHDFQSLAQGFSIGFRPRAGGGIGILVDEQGNDFYSAEVYAQGVSYWYSIGLLFDGGGNDRYSATQYAQGAGVHLSIGSLWDRGGDDHYVAKFGVTQGTAHDLSAGLLLDEGGNDYYLVSDGQGISITNSVALFIDSQGDDFYATPRSGQGALTWARGFCGAGLFLDLEGNDRYPGGAAGADGAAWSQGLYAIGIDLDRDLRLPDEEIPDPVLTHEDSLRTVSELFETASIWEVGSAREKVRRARKALIAKGSAAVDYVVAEKMGTDAGLEYRAILELARAYPGSVSVRVLPLLADSNERVVRNTIRLLGDLKRKDARVPLEGILADRSQPSQTNRLIYALGQIGERESAPLLRAFLRDPEERRRLNAIRALAALKDTAAIASFVGLIEDPELTVRSAAVRALESFRVAAAGPLALRLAAEPSHRRLVVHTLGRIAESLRDSTDAPSLALRSGIRSTLTLELEQKRSPEDPGCRAATVAALARFDDPETIEILRLAMKDETDPLVRRTYESIRGRDSE